MLINQVGICLPLPEQVIAGQFSIFLYYHVEVMWYISNNTVRLLPVSLGFFFICMLPVENVQLNITPCDSTKTDRCENLRNWGETGSGGMGLGRVEGIEKWRECKENHSAGKTGWLGVFKVKGTNYSSKELFVKEQWFGVWVIWVGKWSQQSGWTITSMKLESCYCKGKVDLHQFEEM